MGTSTTKTSRESLFVMIGGMEPYIIIGLVVLVIFVLKILMSVLSNKRKILKNNAYTYFAKEIPMTHAEADFFRKLNNAVSERYYVFPQVHLSAILKPNTSAKDFLYAFRHINGKSVDYVLCDIETLKPTYAVELDDYTHDKSSRRKRDAEVERIFDEANLPLIRFKNKDVSEAEIIRSLVNIHRR